MASSEPGRSIEGVSGEVITTILRKQGGGEVCFAAASEDENIRADLGEAEAGASDQSIRSYRPFIVRSIIGHDRV